MNSMRFLRRRRREGGREDEPHGTGKPARRGGRERQSGTLNALREKRRDVVADVRDELRLAAAPRAAGVVGGEPEVPSNLRRLALHGALVVERDGNPRDWAAAPGLAEHGLEHRAVVLAEEGDRDGDVARLAARLGRGVALGRTRSGGDTRRRRARCALGGFQRRRLRVASTGASGCSARSLGLRVGIAHNCEASSWPASIVKRVLSMPSTLSSIISACFGAVISQQAGVRRHGLTAAEQGGTSECGVVEGGGRGGGIWCGGRNAPQQPRTAARAELSS